jgi:hypothetical protein
MSGDGEEVERLLEIHEGCCGKLDALRAAVGSEGSGLIETLEQVKAALEDELAALGHSFR